MRPDEEYRQALKLIEARVNDCESGRRLGIPRGTIRDWRVRGRSGQQTGGCFRCEEGWVDEEAYAYLLGAYLGDGYLALHPRQAYRLRIVCDLKYPGIVNEIATHVVLVRGVDDVGFTLAEGCVEVSAYWKHWPCVFPQHGPGRKHERQIELGPWQKRIVTTYPRAIVRGLIHSDGNRHINEVTRTLVSGPKRYQYTRYMFTNASADILRIFTDALDLLEVHWTQTTARDISVARREDVAFLDTFVGPKR